MSVTTELSKPMMLEVYNPTGNTQLVQSHAPRLDTLAGKTICELSNGEWGAQRIFPAIREALQKRFPDVNIIPYTEFPVGTEKIDNEATTDMVVSRGCQAVITGNAG
jgi:hypothetical protein